MLMSNLDEADKKKRIENFIKNKKEFGDKRKKITKNMEEYAEILFLEHNAKLADVQDFFLKEFNVSISITSIMNLKQKLGLKKIKKRKSNTRELNIETSKNQSVSVEKTECESLEQYAASLYNRERTGVHPDNVTQNKKHFERKEIVYNHGNDIDLKLNDIEYKLEKQYIESPVKLKGEEWRLYISRYIEDKKLRDFIISNAPLSKIPKELISEYLKLMKPAKKMYYHLKEEPLFL